MQTPTTYREERPWGAFVEFSRNSPTTVKILTVSPREALSLQTHTKRDEFWHIISGSGFITVGESRTPAHDGAEFFIPRGVAHRIEASEQPLVVLEISYGTFEDEDIVRLNDKYGRSSLHS
ncbi:MAG TPA: phosphomannose isomerase type II C-terminal cupin domain [Candidatus Paceibacterota bacterium]|jgi:mannose-6-phosphate isomerase-like protein (cupin superfamily)|nr:phosphomannose isomerase type II C-terminal cupin domain [Candidatus Paceibacterota bacterium]